MNLKLDSFEIIANKDIRLKNDNKNLKFNVFDIKYYNIAVAGHYDVSELYEVSVDELY